RRRFGHRHHSVPRRGTRAHGLAAGGHAAGPRRGGGGVAAGDGGRGLVFGREGWRGPPSRALGGRLLLRLYPPAERGPPWPAPARAVVARGGGGGRELTRASALRCA